MNVAIHHKTHEEVLGANLLVPTPMASMYEAVRDVRSFPQWAPGVRRVEILEGSGEPGMLSEWEVSFLGLRRKVLSVLEDAEPSEFLRWSYEGPVAGWGECSLEEQGEWTLAEFRTVLSPSEPALERLARNASVRRAATSHLKRSLARLGRFVAGERRVVVGSLEDSPTHARGRGRSPSL